MPIIVGINAREVYDSRGNPTVEAEVITESGFSGRAAVPSGASTGIREALELRDKVTDREDKARLFGKGVRQAVENVNEIIAEALLGYDVTEQSIIDQTLIALDGTENKSKLGANALLAVSMACTRAAADYYGMPLYSYLGGIRTHVLPTPMMNVINGGAHASNNVEIQEFMLVPGGFDNYHDALEAGVMTFHTLAKILKERKMSTAVGDEGGYAPNLGSDEDALKLLVEAIEKAGYKPGDQIGIAIDAAASEWLKEGGEKYVQPKTGKEFTKEELVKYWADLAEKYPIISLEDGMAEGDWDGWKLLTDAIGDKIQLVGDDLFVTNSKILKEGSQKKIANSILIKLHQIGTVTETWDAVEMAHRAGYTAIISHRSGETEDSFIADLAVATKAGMIKTGSASRSDRMAKYNQLLRIEEELAEAATFMGFKAFANKH